MEIAAPPEWLLEAMDDSYKNCTNYYPNPPTSSVKLPDAYFQKALDNECRAIETAPDGLQEATLNKAALAIGQIVGAGGLEHQTASQSLMASALRMPNYNERYPWTPNEMEKKIERGLNDGMGEPRKITPSVASGTSVKGSDEIKEDGWADPDLSIIDDGGVEPPEFPLIVFGDLACALQSLAEAKSAPVDYVATAMLSAVSALIGTTRKVSPWPGWSEPPIIWAANIGIPASGKSPALDAILDPLREIELAMAEDYPDQLLEWETKKEAAKGTEEIWKDDVKTAVEKGVPPPVKPEQAVEPEKPARPRLIVSDATIEAIARLLSTHQRGLMLARDELAGWLTSFDRYSGGGERAFWTEAFGGRTFTVDRVKSDGDPLIIQALSVAIIGGIQPDRIKKLLMSGEDDGLASRFLMCWPRTTKPKRPDGTSDNGRLVSVFRKLSALSMGTSEDGNSCPVVIPLDDDAADIFSEFRDDNHQDQTLSDGLYLSHLGKLPGYVLRLALALTYLDWAARPEGTPEPQTVSPRHLSLATHLVDSYFKPMARRVYGLAGSTQEDRDTALLARAIHARHPEKINIRDICRNWSISGLKKAPAVENACNELVELGWLKSDQSRVGSTKGQSRKDYLVNPAIWGSS